MEPLAFYTPEETLLHDIAAANWDNQYINEDGRVKDRCYCGRLLKPILSYTALQKCFSNINFELASQNVKIAAKTVKKTPSEISLQERQQLINAACQKYNELIGKLQAKRNDSDRVAYDALFVKEPQIKQKPQGSESEDEVIQDNEKGKGKEKDDPRVPMDIEETPAEETQSVLPPQTPPIITPDTKAIDTLADVAITEAKNDPSIQLGGLPENEDELVTKETTAQTDLPTSVLPTPNLPDLFPELGPLTQTPAASSENVSRFSLEMLSNYPYTTVGNEEQPSEDPQDAEPKLPKAPQNPILEEIKEEEKKVERRRSPRLRNKDNNDNEEATIERASKAKKTRRRSSNSSSRSGSSSRRNK